MAEHVWAKAKVDALLFHWLSSEHGLATVKGLAEDVKSGKPVPAPTGHVLESSSPQQLRRKIADADTVGGANDSPSQTRRGPQRKKSNNSPGSSTSSSPLATSQNAHSNSHICSPSSSDTSHTPQVLNSSVPPFFEGGKWSLHRAPVNEDSLERRLPEIREVFKEHPQGINVEELLPICKELLDFPSALNVPLFRRIRVLTRIWKGEPISSKAAEIEAQATQEDPRKRVPYNPAYMTQAEEEELIELENGYITEADFLEWWRREIEPYDRMERFFRLVKQPNAKFATARDFFPFVRELIEGHPGLEFLENTPEFQEKYARTVVARILHKVNVSWTGEVTSRELRKSDLLHYFGVADDEEEINSINEYFSYEHFYVIYCKFWELDSDHDFLLGKEDLLRYGGHSLTKQIVERIFQEPARPFTSGVKGKMGFEDFCFFILCEEDKTNANSIRFWFHHVDLDGDGFLRQWEIRTFYDEQLKRMRSLGHEEVTFDDVLCQMRDCLGKLTGKSILFSSDSDDGENSDWAITLKDFIVPDRISFSGSFFNLLFNLNKFIMNESRDPFTTRMQAEQNMTDWDRFALQEYTRLASAEEARNQQQGAYAYQPYGSTQYVLSNDAYRLLHSYSDDEDEADSHEAGDSDSSRSSSEGDFHTKGISEKSALFTNGIFSKDGQGSDEDQQEVSSEDGTDSLSVTSKPQPLSPKYAVTEVDLRLATSRHNLGSIWA